ncbi:MAG: hypothetical protein HRU38_18310 [Saccharospirillaceae bacterium]|nr:HAMP domain-containing histidine kinase [Pseudomonadales bacterium]NRB80591.1 hypothetical protein [Saccharospirillaceae bacterium]
MNFNRLDIDLQLKTKVVLAGLVTTSFILITLILFDVFTGRFTQLFINAFALFINVIAYVALKKYHLLKPVLIMLASLLIAYCFFAVYANGHEGVSALYITLVLPPVFYYLLGFRTSSFLLIPFYLVMLSWSFLSLHYWNNTQWAMIDVLRYNATVLVIWVLSASFASNLVKSKRMLKQVTQREHALLEIRSEELKNQLHAKNQQLGELHHDVTNPLNVIQIHIESIEDGLDSQQSFTVIGQKLKHVHQLLEKMIKQPELNSAYESVELTQLLNQSLSAYLPILQKKNIEVQQNLENNDVYVLVNKVQIQQVFSNLFDNVIKYTDHGGTFKLTSVLDNNMLSICFSDSAPGLTQQELKNLTTRGFRAQATQNEVGTGLGLYICAEIIKAHGGDMQFSQALLGGLTVCINLPLND